MHAPATQALATVVLHAVHAPPFVPQLLTEGSSHVVPEQHPCLHVCAHDSQMPVTHESPAGHAAQAAPFVPHDVADSDA